jgi:hypothetical protein
MTFECAQLSGVLLVLQVLATHEGFQMVLIKNRLMLEFDADATAGYRDMLLNVICLATGHVCEIQVTLEPLLAVKMGGGHVAYELARVLGLFKPETYRHSGALNRRILDGLENGMVQELECRGKAGLEENFDGLLKALASPDCMLTSLKLVGCDWPAGRKVNEILKCLGPQLQVLVVADMPAASGELDPQVFQRCLNLEVFGLAGCQLSGTIPGTVGNLRRLKHLYLDDNQLTGPVPQEIGQCAALELLQLHKNQLSGSIPPSIGNLTKLKKLFLQNSQLTGPVPQELGNLTKLTLLRLDDNQLTGPVPQELGNLTQLTDLRLQNNQLTGPIPPELGRLSNLEQLVLDGNQLDGEVPVEVKALSCQKWF